MQQTRTVIIVLIVILIFLSVGLTIYQFFSGGRSATRGEAGSLTAHDPEARLFISIDGGNAWRGIPGTRGISVTRLRYGRQGMTVYMGTGADGVWRGIGKDLAFVRVEDADIAGSGTAHVTDIVPVEEGERDALVGASYGNRGRVLLLSELDMTELYFAPVNRVQIVGVVRDPGVKERLYVGTSEGGLIQSDDDGKTWHLAHQFSETLALLVGHPRVSGRMWVVGGRGSFSRTDDAGKTWKSLQLVSSSNRSRVFERSSGVQGVYIHPSEERMYIASSQGLFVSFDHGDTWKQVDLPLLPGTIPVMAVGMTAQNPALLYVSAGPQLYKSTDGGASWKGQDFGGRNIITSIAVDPTDEKRIIIGFN